MKNETVSDVRHKTMSHIRSKDTGIEVKLRKALWHKGFRYRKNFTNLPGKPDIVLTKYRIAIFCDSEFFHGKDWEKVLLPKIRKGNNSEYWENKIKSNMKRDEIVNKQLEALGWMVIRLWGKEIEKNTEKCIRAIEEAILDQIVNTTYEIS